MSAWIESHQTLKDHPKLAAMCEHLGAERPPCVGHLHLLWWWCVDYAPDGDLSRYSDAVISRAAEWSGDPAKFVSALVQSGFIDRCENTTKIHDWHDFCGALIERRLKRLAAKRPPMAAERPPTQPNPTQPYPTVPTSKTKAMRTHFSRPSPEEVVAYAKTIGFVLDGQHFCDFYESKGWLVGRAPMRNWRATVRTWKRNGYDKGGQISVARTSQNVRLQTTDPERLKSYAG